MSPMSPTHERPRHPSGPHEQPPAPSLADFEALAAKAYARLPNKFRGLCEDLIIRVDEFPSPEVVRADADPQPLRPARPVPRHRPAVPPGMCTGRMPNMIWLYRRPILAYWRTRRHPGSHRHPRPGARDRAPFRLVRRRHGGDRGGPTEVRLTGHEKHHAQEAGLQSTDVHKMAQPAGRRAERKTKWVVTIAHHRVMRACSVSWIVWRGRRRATSARGGGPEERKTSATITRRRKFWEKDRARSAAF